MDASEGSPERRRLLIDRFVAGEGPLAYGDVVLERGEDGGIVVASFSESPSVEDVTREEAHEKIARSKHVFQHLTAGHPALRAAVAGRPLTFDFRFDTGAAALSVAREVGGALEWRR